MGGLPGPLRVRLLGGLAVDGVRDTEIGSRKARLVVKVLALARGRTVPTGAIADALWGDEPPARPADQVGVLVSRLRGVLGADRVPRRGPGFALVVDWLDVDELLRRTEEAAAALDAHRLAAARAAGRAALELVRGPLLPGDDGDWVEAERATTEAAIARARRVTAIAALRSGDAVGAELAAVAALGQDPYDEAALRVLMEAQALDGRPGSALAAYARVRERLADDLGVSPEPATEALHGAILRGERVPARTETSGPVGRDDEVAELERLVAAGDGQVHVALVTGEPGIGTSSLVAHVADRAATAGVRTLLARADRLGRDLPLQPVLDALGSAATGESATGTLVVGEAGAGRARWFAQVLDALLTDAAPTLLVLEDVHDADASTLDWLAWVAGRRGELTVLVTGRPGVHILGARRLELGPLDVRAIATLIGAGSEPARAADVHARSGGNPLFALAVAASPAGAPSSVDDVVAAALDRLDPADAEVVRAAATLDAIDDIDLLAAVTGRRAGEVIDGLERAAAVGIVAEGPGGFAVRHPLVRDALARRTGAARTALLHREAATALRSRPSHDPLAVAVHARRGGDAVLAAAAFADAADVALRRAELASAEAHLRASLQSAPTAGAHAALAHVLMVAQRLDAAADEAARAIALDGGAAAFETAGWIDYYRRRYDAAQRFADEAVVRAEPGGAVASSALALAGRIRHGAGDPAGAEQRLDAARAGPPHVRALAEVWLGQLRTHQGRPLEALALLDHALLDPDHIAHPFAPLHARFARAVALGQVGQVEDALRACESLRVATERAGAVGERFHAVERNVRSWLLRATGRCAEADELNLEALERTVAPDGEGPRSEGFAEPYWVALLDLADGALVAHELDRAAGLVARLAPVDTWTGTMAWHQRHRLGLLRARIARAAGDTGTAADAAAAVAADAAARGSERYAALARVQLALSDGDVRPETTAPALDVLRRCAALELPALLDELGRAAGRDEWHDEAARRRAALTGPRR